MAVIRDFSHLNSLRPKSAVFGEVCAIALNYARNDIDDWKIIDNIGYSKRKSIHVPPSSNAYWNMMGLFAEVNRFITGKDDASRRIRSELKDIVFIAVEWIHRHELVATYQLDSGIRSYQYYEVDIFPGAHGFDVVVRFDNESVGATDEDPAVTEGIYQFQYSSPL